MVKNIEIFKQYLFVNKTDFIVFLLNLKINSNMFNTQSFIHHSKRNSLTNEKNCDEKKSWCKKRQTNGRTRARPIGVVCMTIWNR